MFTNPEAIENYAKKITDSEPELLKQLNRETYQKILKPRMLSGHLQGRLLSLISKLVAPQCILEIGTFTGYSALCLAEGLTQGGKLHTLDHNEELADFQKKYFDQSPFSQQIIQHTGDAATLIPTIDERFDLVFIDADKKNYGNYYDLVIERVNSGGVIITDNVLWYGKVVEPVKKGDQDTAAILAFNQKLREDPRIENILLPIRDGILISRKK